MKRTVTHGIALTCKSSRVPRNFQCFISAMLRSCTRWRQSCGAPGFRSGWALAARPLTYAADPGIPLAPSTSPPVPACPTPRSRCWWSSPREFAPEGKAMGLRRRHRVRFVGDRRRQEGGFGSRRGEGRQDAVGDRGAGPGDPAEPVARLRPLQSPAVHPRPITTLRRPNRPGPR